MDINYSYTNFKALSLHPSDAAEELSNKGRFFSHSSFSSFLSLIKTYPIYICFPSICMSEYLSEV